MKKEMLRTSEVWMTVLVVIGQSLVAFGVVPKEQWDTVLWPAVVYIAGRITSKVAKKVG